VTTDELSRLVDACLLPAFDGPVPPAWLLERIEAGLGGVILFAHNIRSDSQLRALTTQLRAVRPDLLIGVDEEGGDVTRLEAGSGSSYPGNLALGAVDDVAATRAVAASIGADLARSGVNLNLGPVADVNSNPDNPVIGVRSFGANAALVARHTSAYVEGLQSAGVAACTKHFPGHGDTAVDSHLGLPTGSADPATLELALEPFRAAIAAGTRAIMTAHIVLPAYGADPATVNDAVLTGLLREQLGYDGLVITDALDMGAIRRTIGDVEGAVRAVAAGADALCLAGSEDRVVVEAIRAGMATAVREGRLPESRLAAAAERVRRTAAFPGTAAAVADRAIGLDVARRAVRAHGDVRLDGRLVVVQLQPTPNIAAGVVPWGITAALRALGAHVAHVGVTEETAGTDLLAGTVGRAVVVVARDAHRFGWQRDVLTRILTARPETVVVEMGLPGAGLPAGATNAVLTHGAGRVNGTAAAEVLLGRPESEVAA
jgi:beta-N-acetylhexosaminidase